jgi:deazaflavin-dependent oxidoreductase (nitroreductase family)
VTAISRLTKAVFDNDRDALAEMLTEDMAFHVRGLLPCAGDHSGLDGFLGALAIIFELTERDVKLEDGSNLVALAMNGWDEGHSAWWLNLEAHPHAVVRLARQHPRPVRARLATGEERDRLWQRWVAVDPRLDAYADRRSPRHP